MKFKTKNDFNTYEEYEDYVNGLIRKGILCEGCTYCMLNGGCSCLEDAVEHSNRGAVVYCTPMADVPENLCYPKDCIVEWFGENFRDVLFPEIDFTDED